MSNQQKETSKINHCCTDVSIPLKVCVGVGDTTNGNGKTGLSHWESEWFDVAVSSKYAFEHKLNLQAPWRCFPRLIIQVKNPVEGWTPDEFIFADGTDYVGGTAHMDMGWAIGLSGDQIEVSFGNDTHLFCIAKKGGFGRILKTDVQCKLVISY